MLSGVTERQLTKHSAASSIKPSWNRSSESKVNAIALRIASGGMQRRSLYWNCVNITWHTRHVLTAYMKITV